MATPINEKLDLAVLCFRGGKFERALRLYNELVKEMTLYSSSQLKALRKDVYNISEEPIMGPVVHPKLASVLDQRAATHEKLGEWVRSLKDGENLIKVDPLGCRGYLRTGKVLSRLGRDIEAYKVFQRGVYTLEKALQRYSIDLPEKLYAKLKGEYRDLNRRLKLESAAKSAETPVYASLLVAKNGSSSSTEGATLSRAKPSITPLKLVPGAQNSRSSSTLSGVSSITSASRSSSLTSSSLSKTPTGPQRRLDEMLPLGPSVSAKKPRKSTDPIERLPIDILETVFLQLPLSKVLSCHLVSRTWYNTLLHIPTLYTGRICFKPRISATEYANGLRLIKRITSKTFSKQVKLLRLRSTANPAHFSRILESLLREKNLKMQSLEIVNKDFSMETLFSILNKNNWNTVNLTPVTRLRMGLNSSVRYENALFSIMPNLAALDLLIIDSQLSIANKGLIPHNSHFSKLCELERTIYKEMESLVLINHPSLVKDRQSVGVGEDTFDPSPPLLTKAFPNLTSLTIVSFDFSNMETTFGNFLVNAKGLNSLYLENNDEITLKGFVIILSVYRPSFQLEKLTLREKAITRALSLNEFDADDFPCLHGLKHLDLYGSSLSVRGLSKLLKIVNTRDQMRALNIGNSSYVCFRNDKMSTPQASKMQFSEFFAMVPELENLYINELDLDNSSMRFFCNDIKGKSRLRLLDISFCLQIDGMGLMNLFSCYASERGPENDGFVLPELVIDGMEISKETLQFLTKRGCIQKVKNDPFKTKWRQYGVNSLVPSIP